MLSTGPFQLNMFQPGKWSDDASDTLSRHFTPCDSNITLLPVEFLSPGDTFKARPLTENTHTCLCTQTTGKSLAPGLHCLEMHISSRKLKNEYNYAFINPSQNITPCCKHSRKLKSHPLYYYSRTLWILSDMSPFLGSVKWWKCWFQHHYSAQG